MLSVSITCLTIKTQTYEKTTTDFLFITHCIRKLPKYTPK